MSTTGYLVNTGTSTNPVYKDLSAIFEPYTAGVKVPTGFTTSTGQDLSEMFNPIGTSTALGYNTNLISRSGNDLSKCFKQLIPTLTITVPSGNYYYTYKSGKYTVVVFADYTSQPTRQIPTTNIGNTTVSGISVVFNDFTNANPVYVTAVGGGGGGGTAKSDSTGETAQGGGGGGGGVSIVSFFPTTQVYNIQVGGGGLVQSNGTSSYLKSSILDVEGGGGGYGEGAGLFQGQVRPGGGGAGGTGATSSCGGGTGGYNLLTAKGQGTNGVSSTLLTIFPSSSQYYFGGGGGGGYTNSVPTSIPAGGLGGGGAGTTNGNGGNTYIGPPSIYYNTGDIVSNGYPGVGGGGTGQGNGISTGVGGGGVVILSYLTDP